MDTSVVRVATAGSVDDGKSTLIGRLLHDSKALFTDQLAHVEEASIRRGFSRTELALVTDGLRAEREQGITIDIAWRYFATARRRFILVDTPGHVQYTRNMVTGASHADVAVVLVDAERGPTEQTRRHLLITAVLGVPRVILAINKMDRVGWDRARFEALRHEAITHYTAAGGTAPLSTVPLSALSGDNLVFPSTAMPWYDGPTLLSLLENARSAEDSRVRPGRFPVQWVIRPQDEAFHDYRGLAGRMAAGTLRVGDDVVVLPSGRQSTIRRIENGGDDWASTGDSVVIHLGDDIDVSRGDLIASRADAPALVDELDAEVCWLSTRPLVKGAKLTVKQTTRKVKAVVEDILHERDVATGTTHPADRLDQNGLGRIRLRLSAPLALEAYTSSRSLGSMLLIDEPSGETVAAAMYRP